MIRVYQNQFSFDEKTMEDAIRAVRETKAPRAVVVESDGVHMIQRMTFDEGAMVEFEFNIDGRMVSMVGGR